MLHCCSISPVIVVFVIFLTRRSHLREQHCFPADSSVKLGFRLQLLLLLRGFIHLASRPCALCVVKQKVSVELGASCPGIYLRGAPGGIPLHADAARCSLHPTAPTIACHTATPEETMPLWLTIMGSGRINGRQGRSVREILQELLSQTKGSGNTHLSSPAASEPVTAGAAWEKHAVIISLTVWEQFSWTLQLQFLIIIQTRATFIF